ncbi:hypothetical protein WISP_142313 [Willisornis vidua]|uniref:Uncharacterized protein n=1 Tax=Willisornis vidua TaxID=1566151 RepID=A0ABQ9CRK8_9PASS|nr:hypothetical protein WISP_142313 [Willisornis vidua]
MDCQLFQQYTVGDSVKGLAEVQTDHIHSLPLIHHVGYLIIKGDQVDQTGPGPPKPMLAGSNPLSILQVLCDCTQDDLLHNLARHHGQAHKLVVVRVLLATRFVDWCDTGHPPIIWDLPSELGLLVDDG